MRIVILLIVLAIIGLLVTQRINTPPSDTPPPEATREAPPQVPTRPQDVEAFNEQMQQFTDDAAARRQQQIDQATE
ncbi:hypothetical protein [Alcanivorax sp. S71-1-4]|uniref:hypothetical protein n=1 Tax=Alcanivorax sp. S71-1-4 TaxID=1177159 RepID=UPI001358683A|nr:hypothetical protein [Alcanivorax sp. S71-1-4]